MGTNFYWIYKINIDIPTGESIGVDDMNPVIHIGKRSAAGTYCWDCNMTLCKGGEEGIHYDYGFYDNCPKCGKSYDFKLNQSAAGVELGFNKQSDIPKSGVTSCCSFSFAQDPERVRKICKENPEKYIVIDEYDKEYTGQAFLNEVINNCPVHRTGSIGEWFS